MSLWSSPKGEALPDAFFEVARKVYDDDPHWPVEDEAVVRWMFSPRHAYGEGIDWAVCGVGDKARAGYSQGEDRSGRRERFQGVRRPYRISGRHDDRIAARSPARP